MSDETPKTVQVINTNIDDYARPPAKKGSKQHGGESRLKFPFDRLIVKPTPKRPGQQ